MDTTPLMKKEVNIMAEKQEWWFSGSVYVFDTEVARNYEASTMAVSEKKAISNIIYRFKKETGRAPTCKVSLVGKIQKA